MKILNLFKNFKDTHLTENFAKISDHVNNDPLAKGRFIFREYVLKKDTAGSSYPATLTFAHGLNFAPIDIIQLYQNPTSASVTWNHENFDRTNISVTIDAEVTVRIYLGRYGEE